jgi:hypothetical protein
MYPVVNCRQVVTNDIIQELVRLYSQPALPDLIFQNIFATKQGRSLDINFSVINQGLVNADNVQVILYEDNDKITKFSLGNIEFGAGKIVYQQGLRVSLENKQLRLVIEASEEIDKKNNIAILDIQT